MTLFKALELEAVCIYDADMQSCFGDEESKDHTSKTQPYDRHVVISIGCQLLVQLIDKSTEGLPLHPCLTSLQEKQQVSKVHQSKAQIAQITMVIENDIIPFYFKQEGTQ